MQHLKNNLRYLLIVSALCGAVGSTQAGADGVQPLFNYDYFDNLFFFEDHQFVGDEPVQADEGFKTEKELPPECLTPVWAMCTEKRRRR